MPRKLSSLSPHADAHSQDLAKGAWILAGPPPCQGKAVCPIPIRNATLLEGFIPPEELVYLD